MMREGSVGASEWDHVAPYIDDPQEMLERLHQQVLVAREYLWSDEERMRPRR